MRGGWSLLADDPFGLLLPTAGMLLVDASLAVTGRAFASSPMHLVAAVVGLYLVRPLLHAPFLARLTATAATMSGATPWPWGRPLALVGAELVVVPLVGVAFALPVLLGAAAAGAIANEGWLATAAVAFAGFAVAGAVASLVVRAVFARVPWEVAVAGRSSVGAVWAALRSAGTHAPSALVLLAAGDVLVGLSMVICGALVLPGYPLVWLALAHRWGHSPEPS